MTLNVITQAKAEKSIAFYEKALEDNPADCDTYYNLGIKLNEEGRVEEAICCYRKAVDINPHDADAYYNLGIALYSQGEIEEAVSCYRKCININSHDQEAYNNLACAFKEMGEFAKAEKCLRKSIELKPDYSIGYNNLGLVLSAQGKIDEAIMCYNKALTINPEDPEIYVNMGLAFKAKKQLYKASSFYKKALKLKPNYPEAHFDSSLLLLLSGILKDGWKEYEWRLLRDKARKVQFPQPRWDGSDLEKRVLLVYAEQGIGDEIMFASCLPDLLKLTENCVVECDPRLIPLFGRSFQGIQLISRRIDEEKAILNLRHTDFKIPIGSLPLYFRKRFTEFPQQTSYLIPDAQKVSLWKKRFEALGPGICIGISWLAGKKTPTGKIRSIDLQKWDRLFTLPGIHLINLQYGDCTDELRRAGQAFGKTIHDWEDSDPLADMDTFAAQIKALDLVISVDNSTVHLAGSLGVPVWTMLPFSPDWRWMLARNDSPWYPTMRLFRQPTHGDWKTVFQQVAQELRKLLFEYEVHD